MFSISCTPLTRTAMFIYLYLLLLFITLYTITQHFLNKILNHPPTPFPTLPLFGHIYLLSKNPKLPLQRTLSSISDRHGPITFLQLGSRPVLLVSSPSAAKTAKQCFTENDVVFANRPNLLNGKHFGYNFTSLAWSSYGDHWRNLRRISSVELLSSHQLNLRSGILKYEARALIRKILGNFSDSNEIVGLRSVFFEYSYNVVMRMITGEEEGGEIGGSVVFEEIVREMARVTIDANVVDFVPFLGSIWGWFWNVEEKMVSVQRRRDEFMKNVIEECSRRKEDGGGGGGGGAGGGCVKKDLMQFLMDLQKKESEYYTDEAIRNLLLVLVQGATHTTSTTLEWALSLLLKNPAILQKARTQIENHTQNKRLITLSDLPEIPYLRCIINETLRMHPAAPLLTPHVSNEKCMIGGFDIPCGTILLVNAWDIQNNSEIWEEPEKFMPERFEGDKIYEFKYIPFGWGRRACPGENLAMNMVGIVLGCLIQCFDWESVGEIDMSEGRGVITEKVEPLCVKFVPRDFVLDIFS